MTAKGEPICIIMQKWLFLFVLALPLSASEPKELAEAKASYEAAVERAVAPLRDKYVAHLKKLVEQYTKAGKLDEAMKARQEMIGTALSGSYLSQAKGRYWETTFHAGGSVEAAGFKGEWTVKNDMVVVTFKIGTVYTIPLESILQGEPRGESVQKNGVRETVVFKRQ